MSKIQEMFEFSPSAESLFKLILIPQGISEITYSIRFVSL